MLCHFPPTALTTVVLTNFAVIEIEEIWAVFIPLPWPVGDHRQRRASHFSACRDWSRSSVVVKTGNKEV